MTESWSIREKLFAKKREREYLMRYNHNNAEKKGTLMAVALINSGMYNAMHAEGHGPVFSEGKGGIF
jgi:hypothetical protein